MLSSMQTNAEQHQSSQEKGRQQNRNQTTGKSKLLCLNSAFRNKLTFLIAFFFSIRFAIDVEMMTPITCNTSRPMDATNANCNPQTTLPHSPNRLSHQSPPSEMTNNSIHHTISQPYLGDSSNFGPFYHHHHPHLNYGNPYDKYKIPSNVHYSRSPNTSPYGTYQGFYAPNSTHHHPISRSNGYIDVPR